MSQQTLLSRFYFKILPDDHPPYQVDDGVYQRFDQRNNLTVGRPNWDETVKKFARQAPANRVTKIRSGRPGYALQDYSLFLAGGVSVRLSKVVTDLPLVRDHPIRFGVTEFCGSCQKCATACPVEAISVGERTWARENISNSPGQLTWHLDNELCRRYWAMGNGDNCTVCVRACPFTKGPGVAHDLVRTAISRVPGLNPLWRGLDDTFGYGQEIDASAFWQEV